MNIHNKAFTLVELIVVITILAILGTIAFISFQGYSATSRDSVRTSDMNNIGKTLELFHLSSGKYPETTNPYSVTFSGSEVWTQGIFGETTFKSVDKLDTIPKDPLTEAEYVYSVTNNRQEYQIAGIFENSLGLNQNEILDSSYAAGKTAQLKVEGNYNGRVIKVNDRVIKVNDSNLTYVLAIPSIISSTGATLEDIIQNDLLAYDGYKNLPFNYGGGYDTIGEETNLNLVNDTSYIVFSGSVDELIYTNNQTIFIESLKLAYISTDIENQPVIYEVLNSENDLLITQSIIKNNINSKVEININNLSFSDWRGLDPNCDIPDIVIGTQTWAGCNSTLGNGLEYGQTDANIGTNTYSGTVLNCYDYSGNNTATCIPGDSIMSSNTKANTWFSGTNTNGDTEVENIWGKFYTWINSPSACPSGYHLPSDIEFEILETTLNGGINCRNLTNGSLCDGLGWKLHLTSNSGSSMIEKLKIPLSGQRNIDGYQFPGRGNYTGLWSYTSNNSSSAYSRNFGWNSSTIYRGTNGNQLGLPVRCIKD